jgi:hypothetical protein
VPNPYIAISPKELVPAAPTLAGVVQTTGVSYSITPWVTQEERPTSWTAAVTVNDPDGVTRQGIYIGTTTANPLTAGLYMLWVQVAASDGETAIWQLGTFTVI